MTYIECPECGQKALSVATRCPRCGHNYPQRPIWKQASSPKLDRLRPLLPIVAVLVVGVVLVVVIAHLAGSEPAAMPVVASPVAPPGPAPSAPASASADSLIAAAPPPRPPPRSAASGVQRYARTWVNVREDRGRDAPAVRVLHPGEVVMVDSLRRGWYRVLAGGHTLGYVHRSNLDAVPPPTQP